jgi:hypothetical protein
MSKSKGEYLVNLRRSNAAGIHKQAKSRRFREVEALEEQMTDLTQEMDLSKMPPLEDAEDAHLDDADLYEFDMPGEYDEYPDYDDDYFRYPDDDAW